MTAQVIPFNAPIQIATCEVCEISSRLSDMHDCGWHHANCLTRCRCGQDVPLCTITDLRACMVAHCDDEPCRLCADDRRSEGPS